MKERINVTEQVISDLSRRSSQGAKLYGEPLTTHNGRDALQDAYEEAMDLCCYLKQAILERGEAAEIVEVNKRSCLRTDDDGVTTRWPKHDWRGRSVITFYTCRNCGLDMEEHTNLGGEP